MADYIKSIMTADGPKPIDYKSLANLPSLNEQQSDWNQSNATAPGFIKNKTHYLVYEDNGSIVENATIISGWDSNFNPTSITISNMPVNNEPVNIYIDGVKYENIQCVSTISGNQQMTHYYGEFDQDLNPKYDNLPFVFGIMTGNNMSAIAVLAFSDGNTDEHTVSVHSINETVHKLDEKYLPKHSHSWNDLEDKPFYSDGKVILETDGNFDDAERIEIVGGINFAGLTLRVGTAVIRYGAFLQNVINFLIIAFAIFMLVKLINKFFKKKEEVKEVVKSEEVILLEEIRDLLKKNK